MFETDDDANFRKFNNEVFESLERGHSDGVKVDNLVLEINSSRHAYAVTQSQVVQSVVTSILQLGMWISRIFFFQFFYCVISRIFFLHITTRSLSIGRKRK